MHNYYSKKSIICAVSLIAFIWAIFYVFDFSQGSQYGRFGMEDNVYWEKQTEHYANHSEIPIDLLPDFGYEPNSDQLYWDKIVTENPNSSHIKHLHLYYSHPNIPTPSFLFND